MARKILYVLSVLERGGTEQQLYYLIKALRPDATLVSLGGSGPWEQGFRDLGIEVIPLKRRGKADLSRIFQLRRIIRSGDYDIVHMFIDNVPGIYGHLAVLLAGHPRFITGERASLLAQPSWYREFKRLFLRRVRRIICNSQTSAGQLVSLGLARADQVEFIPNGIELDRFSHLNDAERPITIGMVGHLSVVKNPGLFVRAAAQLLEQFPEVRFIHVGEGALLAEMQALARDLHIDHALTNGTSIMCALGVLETYRAEMLMKTGDIAGSLSLEALNGTPLAFDERIHRLRPFPRQQECAAYLRALLANSQFTRGYDPLNVQDAYSLRCMPQVHGAVRDAVAYCRWAIEIELNAVTDNPLIFLGDTPNDITVLSGGNFHGEPLAIAMDYLGIAMSELGNISERRIARLIDESVNTHVLPAFLTRNGGLNSGFMLVQYTAAALATESKVLSHPASVDTIPTSANVEDHVSMGCTAALKARRINNNVERILGIELFAAAQGIDFRREVIGADMRQGDGTRPVYVLIRQHIPFIELDTVLYRHMETLRQLVVSGQIERAAAAGIGAR